MPWPEGHKASTRERIVRAAAEAFRAKGVGEVRIAEVMARAGLTHGGFYAHFASKADLVGPALDQANQETVERISAAGAGLPGALRLRAAIDAYLSEAHAAHPERGCPVATLGPELARAGGARRQLARGIQDRLRWMRELLPGRRSRAADDRAVGILAGMIGGVILARAVEPGEGDAVLAACRRFLHGALDEPGAAQEPGSR